MLWLLAAVLIPVLVLVLLVLSAMGDLWSIITFQLDFRRLLGDLVHVLLILVIGAVAEMYCFFELILHIL